MASKLVGSRTDRPNPRLHNTARCYSIAQRELSPVTDSLCDIVKCQLCIVARPELEEFSEARSEFISLQDVDISPLDSKRDSRGQWASPTVEEAIGLYLRTPIATVQVLCVLPRAEDSKASYLLKLVRLQAITRREAKEAT